MVPAKKSNRLALEVFTCGTGHIGGHNVKAKDIKETYMELEKSMGRLVRSQEDAFSILWFDIYAWLEPERPAVKADLCGILTKKIIGKNIGERVHIPARDNTQYYQKIQAKYAFGKSIYTLGEHWKELICEKKSFDLWVTLGCLDIYYKTIMPCVKNEMVACWGEELHGNQELVPTLKPYRDHRAKIKATMQIIETASDVFTLQLQHRNEKGNEEL